MQPPQDNNIIIIDQEGSATLDCCTTVGSNICNCSDLSLALKNMEDNTVIQINSNISLLTVVQFDKAIISNVSITGSDHVNPIIECNNTGGFHGENGNNIIIKDIIWDKCELKVKEFTNAKIINCQFQHTIREFALIINNSSALVERSKFVDNIGGLWVHSSQTVSICECNFIGNSQNMEWTKYKNNINNDAFPGYAIYSNSSNLVLNSSNFSSNANSAVMLANSQFIMMGSITLCSNTLYNNSTGVANSVSKEFHVIVIEQNGAAMNAQNSDIKIAGETISFMNNKAAKNGGAIFLNNSHLSFHQGTIIFHSNSAVDGGAIYIDKDSHLQVSSNKSSFIKFVNNTAMSRGGAMYININNASNIPQYYNTLVDTMHNDSNVACNYGNYAYFAIINTQCQPNKTLTKSASYLIASSPCSVVEDFDNAVVKVNKSDYGNESVHFWLHDLKLNLAIVDYFGHHLDPGDFNHTGSLSCNSTKCRGHNASCKAQINEFNYSIVKIDNDNTIVTLKSSTNGSICCCLSNFASNVITLSTPSNNLTDIHVTVIWRIPLDDCKSDIGHFILNDECLATSCNNLQQASSFPPGLACPNGYMTATPGHWYNKGFKQYITSCSADNCNLTNWYGPILVDPFPKRDFQCKGNWKGFACGECHFNANYTIKYDTTECIPADECLISSLTYSVLILFGISFFYWIVIITLIFVLLHFNFNIKAGYAYGIIFYYSVLQHIVVVFNEIVQTENCGFSNDEHYYQCFSVETNHEFLKVHLLPFLSAIGILKPPFMQYMRLCLGNLEMIDHIFLMYIHPFIVIPIVTVLYISTRRFVIMARLIGRFINSTSVCILVLLSYSSVSHTSLKLLRPLPYFEFKPGAHDSRMFKGWRSYWSPAKHYFDGQHKYYVIVAILCEVIIGIGVPVFLLLQRNFIRRLNLNFGGMRLILDQLQGCYRNNCYHFAAYYMICRQIFYCVDILIVFETFLWTDHISVKLVIMLIISIVILVIHLWFQPYNTAKELQTQNLNVLDTMILFTLVMLLVCSLDGRSYGVTVIFWILPLLFLFNYLTYSTKLKHAFVLCSICGVMALACMLVFLSSKSRFYYMNLVSILCLLTSLCTFLMYITIMLKQCVCVRCCHHREALESSAQDFDISVESA